MNKKLLPNAALFTGLLLSTPAAFAVGSDFPAVGITTVGPTWCYGPEPGCPLPPDKWVDEFPDCAGTSQSPVDITGTTVNRRVPKVKFEYSEADELIFKNNGHTTEAEYEPSATDKIIVDGEDCKLLQFHFHTHSETDLGGSELPVEAHLVHQCDSGKIAVVAVMMQYLDGVDPNDGLQTVLDNAPESAGTFIVGDNHVMHPGLSATEILPKKAPGNYYAFDGSFTTPPCTEGIQWFVLQKTVGISKDQVDTLKKIFMDTSPDGFPYNDRPTQDLNGRALERRKRRLTL